VKGPRSALTSFLEEKGINARKIRDSYFQRNRGTRRPKTPGDGMRCTNGNARLGLEAKDIGMDMAIDVGG
jgi:hypothetical protein